MPRWPWRMAALGALVAALFGGRWLALYTTDRLWAESLGIGTAHADIAALRLALRAGAILVASTWFLGNLLLVYRQIGAVQVPRRVGDLEIVEHVPRRYLLVGAIVVAVVLGAVASVGTGDWWEVRALATAAATGEGTDPILQRDVGYYLFRLPWLRALHGFAVLLGMVALVLLALLYAAIGAVRRQDRRLVLAPFARAHLAALLGTVAILLASGYLLEPAELVAGLAGVPYDTVLTDVRIPVARVLAFVTCGVALASLAWMRVERGMVVGMAWGVWAVGTFVGHIVLPSAVAAGRGPEGRTTPELVAAGNAAVRRAFGLRIDSVAVPLAVPDPGFAARHRATLAAAPLWDAFVLTEVLNRGARQRAPDPRSGDRFYDATLVVVPHPGGGVVPAYLAVREPDSLSHADGRAPWAARHGDPQAFAVGAVAVHATRTADGGRPLFIPALGRPDSLTSRPVDVQLRTPEVWFAPGTSDYAVTAPDRGPVGTAAGSFPRRLALAWALQAPALLSEARVARTAVVVADRAVATRLARAAPFARFGAPAPALLDGRLLWIAPGYVAGEGYPLGQAVVWRGARVRYLHAGFVGTVDAVTGATAVYLAADADPVSRAWADVLPDLVRPANALPPIVATALRYPEELFAAQLQVLRSRPGRARPAEPFWWVGPSVGDSTVRLRLRVVDEVQLDARVAAVIEGVVESEGPRLRVLRYPEPYAMPGPADLERAFRASAPPGAAVGGRLRFMPFEDGAVALQVYYADSGTVAGVVAGWRGAVGRGGSLVEALDRLVLAPGAGPAAVTAATPYEAAREWFLRLDRARAAGDWQAFGEAWVGLRDALGLTSGPAVAAPGRRD